MPLILILLNAIAFIFAVVMLVTLPRAYKLLFLGAGLIPLLVTGVIAYFAYDPTSWGLKEVAMILLRGGFIVGVISGTLTCYLATKLKNKET